MRQYLFAPALAALLVSAGCGGGGGVGPTAPSSSGGPTSQPPSGQTTGSTGSTTPGAGTGSTTGDTGSTGTGGTNAGTGGAGGGPGGAAAQTVVSLDVLWPDRSRVISAPGSALSATVTLTGAAPGGGDFTFSVDRDAPIASHSTHYASAGQALVGTWPMTMDFFANPGSAGARVATATVTVAVSSTGSLTASDGTPLGDITPSNAIASVSVDANQVVAVGATQDIAFTARDAGGAVVAVTPGSALFAVVSGSASLSFVSGQAHGLAPGTATVTALVDGITSPAASVTVASGVVVNVTPSTPTVSVGSSTQFTATVSGQPAGASPAVAWSVIEPNGGSISAGGKYTAPKTAGVYHVRATSQYDGTKFATATITVQSGGASGTIQ